MNQATSNSNVSVRPLRDDDVPALHAACWPTLSREEVHARVARSLSLARRGRAWPLVGLHGEKVVGFGQLTRWRNTGEIADLVVGAQWQSHGVGTAIVQRLLELAREQGFGRAEVGVAESNTRAHALYRRLGFTRLEGRLPLDLGNGLEPVIYLSQALHEHDE